MKYLKDLFSASLAGTAVEIRKIIEGSKASQPFFGANSGRRHFKFSAKLLLEGRYYKTLRGDATCAEYRVHKQACRSGQKNRQIF